MTRRNGKPLHPGEDFAVAPGETLEETIEALGLSQIDLATRSGLSPKTVNRIIKGNDPLSQETALRLERVTGVPARFWNVMVAS